MNTSACQRPGETHQSHPAICYRSGAPTSRYPTLCPLPATSPTSDDESSTVSAQVASTLGSTPGDTIVRPPTLRATARAGGACIYNYIPLKYCTLRPLSTTHPFLPAMTSSSQPPSPTPSRPPSPSYAAVLTAPVPRRQSTRSLTAATSLPSTSSFPVLPPGPPHTPVSPPTSLSAPSLPPPQSPVSASASPRPRPALQDVQTRAKAIPAARAKGKGKQNESPAVDDSLTSASSPSASRTRTAQASRQVQFDLQASLLANTSAIATLSDTVRSHRVATLRDMERFTAVVNGRIVQPPTADADDDWHASFDTLEQRVDELQQNSAAETHDLDRDLSRRLSVAEDRILVLERRGDVVQVRGRLSPDAPSQLSQPSHTPTPSPHTSVDSRSPPPTFPTQPLSREDLPVPSLKRPRSPDPVPRPTARPKTARARPKTGPTPTTLIVVRRPPTQRTTVQRPVLHEPAVRSPAYPPPSTTTLYADLGANGQHERYLPPPTTLGNPNPASQDSLPADRAAYLGLLSIRITSIDVDLWSPDRARNHRVLRGIASHFSPNSPLEPLPPHNAHVDSRATDFFFPTTDDLVAFIDSWDGRPPSLFDLYISQIPSSLLGDIVARDPPTTGPSSRRGQGPSRGRAGYWVAGRPAY